MKKDRIKWYRKEQSGIKVQGLFQRYKYYDIKYNVHTQTNIHTFLFIKIYRYTYTYIDIDLIKIVMILLFNR